MSRDNDTKKACSETLYVLTVSYQVALPEREALALAQENLSGGVIVPASLMLWLQYWVPATTLASAQHLTAALCLLCILKGDG
ncbi:MAG TPA: hypothetical protein VJ323_17635, partial [Bryobacteraceae bacterium]|nr:hypothetical protein [Bryobacteraceae bacterium]